MARHFAGLFYKGTIMITEETNIREATDEKKIRKKRRKKRRIVVLMIALLVFAGVKNVGYRKAVRKKVESYKEAVREELSETGGRNASGDAVLQDYYYKALNKGQRNIYTDILEGVKSHREEIRFEEDCQIQDLKLAFSAVFYDHPEIFWVDVTGYRYISAHSGDRILGIKPTYLYSKKDQEREQGKIDRTVEKLLKKAEGKDPYGKLVTVYRYLIDHTEYDQKNTTVPKYQCIDSVLVGGKSVCAGYAKSLKYILEKMEIPCIVVSGREKGDDEESHLWNMAMIDDTTFYLDVTWDDSYDDENAPAAAREAYDNLGMNDALMRITHELGHQYGSYPACKTLTYYYYLRDGSYFDLCDWDILLDKITGDIDAGRKSTTIKFVRKEDYDAFINGMAKEMSDKMLGYTGMGRVRYYQFPDRYRVIYLWKK